MRIVNIHRKFIDEYTGGTTVYNLNLCSYIARKTIDVHHVVGTHDISKHSYEKWQNLHLHRIYLPYGNRVLNYIYRLYKTKELVRDINNKHNIDGIFFHEGGLIELIRYDRKLKKIPMIFFFHAPHFYELLYDFNKRKKKKGGMQFFKWLGMRIHSMKFKILEGTNLKFANKIVVMSAYSKKNIVKFYNLEDYKKIEVIPIGIDINTYIPPMNINKLREEIGVEDEIIFLALRRHAPRMGLENLILAFKELIEESKDNIALYIGGKGILTNDLKKMVIEFKLEKHIKFLGFLSEPDKVKYLQLADAVVVPSEDLEGFGIVNIEALACNTPVIGTNVGAIPEILAGITPELIAYNSSSRALKEKMRSFLENIEDYKTKGAAHDFSRYAHENYSWENISTRIIDTLRDI